MEKAGWSRGVVATAVVGALMLTLGCSGSTEDVRVTFCKGLANGLVDTGPVEWTGGENRFKRPSYATTALTFTAAGSTGDIACHFAYEALDDTAVNLANPLDAYDTLPFAVSLNGRVLSDEALVAAVRAEQKRQGMALLQGLQQGASDLAEQVRAGVSQ